MARVRVPIAFNRIDRWLIGLGVAVAAYAYLIVRLSQPIVAPPRPKISESERPMVGLGLRAATGGVRVVRASGPAHDAGLRAGDRIVRIDDVTSPTVAAFASYVLGRRDGDMVKIEARRSTAGSEDTGVLAEVKVAVRKISPADEGLPFEDVSFRNADGLTLRGWYIPPPAEGSSRAPAVAYGHGNGTDRRQWLPYAAAIHFAGFAQLLFDFTGRGESDGEVISLGLHEAGDLRAALDLLAARPEIDPLRLALAGRSMGAAAAIFEAADDARVKALVLDSPFADLRKLIDLQIASAHVPVFLIRGPLLAFAGWRANYDVEAVRPVAAIPKVRAPMLLLHGDRDTLVPYDDAKALQAAAKAPLTFVPLTGLGHNDPRPEDYAERIAGFLSKGVSHLP